MAENQTLRNMLRELGNFIGSGLGGGLNKIGWTMDQYKEFVNRTETDTAYEAFESSKRKSHPASSSTDDLQNPNKRKRTDDGQSDDLHGLEGLSALINGGNPNSLHAQSPTLGIQVQYPLMNNPLLSDPQSSAFLPQHMSSSTAQNGVTAGNVAADPQGVTASSGSNTSAMFPPSYGTPLNVYNNSPNVARQATNAGLPPIQNTSATPQATATSAVYESIVNGLLTDKLIPGTHDEASFTKKNEAGRLIKYHLDNFRRNPSYCLPRSLNPTLVQRTVAHEQIIDAVPFPELRDRLILLKDRFSLPEVMHLLFLYTTIHGDDVLQHGNWEVQKQWMDRFPFLVDEPMINIANRWRRERGEQELKLSDYTSEHS
ncbi:hypothetical protein FRC03_011508 [Tulasnella sp. 419]|nr:hypothetical protein FRC03_011508 [Tulasnella sp. 419]